MSPGEVYELERGPAGKPRYVVVVSREELNRGESVVVVPVTSTRFNVRKDLPNCVPFGQGEFGFTENCVAQAEQVSKIPTYAIVSAEPAFKLNDDAMTRIVHAIGDVIGCQCEPFAL